MPEIFPLRMQILCHTSWNRKEEAHETVFDLVKAEERNQFIAQFARYSAMLPEIQGEVGALQNPDPLAHLHIELPTVLDPKCVWIKCIQHALAMGELIEFLIPLCTLESKGSECDVPKLYILCNKLFHWFGWRWFEDCKLFGDRKSWLKERYVGTFQREHAIAEQLFASQYQDIPIAFRNVYRQDEVWQSLYKDLLRNGEVHATHVQSPSNSRYFLHGAHINFRGKFEEHRWFVFER